MTTRRNLHSHNYPSPLSNNQEVSAYGEEGVGDEGDRWKVVCSTKNDYWVRNDPVRFQHVVTGKYDEHSPSILSIKSFLLDIYI